MNTATITTTAITTIEKGHAGGTSRLSQGQHLAQACSARCVRQGVLGVLRLRGPVGCSVLHYFAGPDVFGETLIRDAWLLASMLPRVVVALSIAALIWIMLPRERISRLVGAESGLMGLVIATAAGTVTPGGPSSAFALLAVLGATGADRGALITYITAWAMLGLQRILVWDVPFMGAEFAMLRFCISLPLPLVAGLIARQLPLTLTLRDEGDKSEPPA